MNQNQNISKDPSQVEEKQPIKTRNQQVVFHLALKNIFVLKNHIDSIVNWLGVDLANYKLPRTKL